MVLLLLFSSCGVITKARYGNGFKLNIETGLFSKDNKLHQPKLSKTYVKKSIQKQDFLSKDSVIDYSEIKENPPIDTIASICEFTHYCQNELIRESEPQSKVFESKKWTINKTKHVEKKVNTKYDERPLAPYLILALILAFFMPYVSIYLAIRAKKLIKESNDAYKGNGFATAIIILSILTFILGIIASIFIYMAFASLLF